MRVLTVFCEGPHDLHFASRSVIRHANYQQFDGPALDLPTPLGGHPRDRSDPEESLVLRQVRRLDPLKLDLDRLNFGKKPLFESAAHDATGNDWAVFVNMGGDSNATEVLELIKLIRASRVKRNIQLKQLAFAFMFDADFESDKRGLLWRIGTFASQYGPVFPGIDAHLKDVAQFRNYTWMMSENEAVGLWIHRMPEHFEGTLEDHVGPAFHTNGQWRASVVGALDFIDAQVAEGAPTRAKRDKRWKAAITIAGQIQKPADGRGTLVGSGLNVMVQKGLPDEALDADICKALAVFLTSAPWTAT